MNNLKFYNWFLRLLVPVVLLRLIWRGFRNHAYWRRWPERFGFIEEADSSKHIWIHAVSVGEVRAAALLVPAMVERYPDYRVLITTMTPTGSDQVRKLFNGQVDHCYVPYDLLSAIRRFLDRTKPKLALIMETELWPNLFHTCHQRSIPILVSNVRLSEKSMKGYLRFPKLARSTLNQVSMMAVQNDSDAVRLKRLGAEESRLQVTGSIKFEVNAPASFLETAEVLRREWGTDRPIWIAASTREGEDELVLQSFAELKAKSPDLLLVLVPRHPERFASVARLSRRKGYQTLLRSQQRGPVPSNVEILIGDTMGELQIFYAAADVAFIGGSLVPTGGHNLLEAAAVGTPIVFGPHMLNFQEISELALERGAATQINDSDGLASAIAHYLNDAEARFNAGEKGKKMVEENRGALKSNLALIDKLMHL